MSCYPQKAQNMCPFDVLTMNEYSMIIFSDNMNWFGLYFVNYVLFDLWGVYTTDWNYIMSNEHTVKVMENFSEIIAISNWNCLIWLSGFCCTIKNNIYRSWKRVDQPHAIHICIHTWNVDFHHDTDFPMKKGKNGQKHIITHCHFTLRFDQFKRV